MTGVLETLAHAGSFAGWVPFFSLVIGLVVGILVGVLPGLGPLLGVIMAIPFTFHMDAVSGVALLLGIYQGGSYGGAITATLLGIPGTPMAAATLLDAHPMALKGFASEAVTLSTLGSSVGGFLGGLVLVLTAPLLAKIAIGFGPAETFSLALLGLTAIATLSQGSAVKGLLAGLIGLSLASVGNDPITGFTRFNFGTTYLEGGITFVALLFGLFAISEVLLQFEKPVRAWQAGARVGVAFSTFKTLWTKPMAYVRSALVGVIIGVIPGIGGVTSSFLSYKLAKDFSKHPENFGKGEVEGVIASETANSATTGGALIPMLAIGIPGDPIVAAMMGGLLIQGLTPGPALFFTNREFLGGIFAAFIVGAVLLLPIGLALIPLFVRIIKIPHSLLMATVLLLSIFGTYAVQRQVFDLWQLWLFGIVGYAMRKGGFPLAPLIIGFVLGPIFETNMRRATIIMGDDFFGFMTGRPIALGVMGMVVLSLLFPIAQNLFLRRKGRQANQPA